jgi:hypothetical protein
MLARQFPISVSQTGILLICVILHGAVARQVRRPALRSGEACITKSSPGQHVGGRARTEIAKALEGIQVFESYFASLHKVLARRDAPAACRFGQDLNMAERTSFATTRYRAEASASKRRTDEPDEPEAGLID